MPECQRAAPPADEGIVFEWNYDLKLALAAIYYNGETQNAKKRSDDPD